MIISLVFKNQKLTNGYQTEHKLLARKHPKTVVFSSISANGGQEKRNEKIISPNKGKNGYALQNREER